MNNEVQNTVSGQRWVHPLGSDAGSTYTHTRTDGVGTTHASVGTHCLYVRWSYAIWGGDTATIRLLDSTTNIFEIVTEQAGFYINFSLRKSQMKSVKPWVFPILGFSLELTV